MHDGMIKISTSITSIVVGGCGRRKSRHPHNKHGECHENEPEKLIRPCAIQINEDGYDVVMFLQRRRRTCGKIHGKLFSVITLAKKRSF